MVRRSGHWVGNTHTHGDSVVGPGVALLGRGHLSRESEQLPLGFLGVCDAKRALGLLLLYLDVTALLAVMKGVTWFVYMMVAFNMFRLSICCIT